MIVGFEMRSWLPFQFGIDRKPVQSKLGVGDHSLFPLERLKAAAIKAMEA